MIDGHVAALRTLVELLLLQDIVFQLPALDTDGLDAGWLLLQKIVINAALSVHVTQERGGHTGAHKLVQCFRPQLGLHHVGQVEAFRFVSALRAQVGCSSLQSSIQPSVLSLEEHGLICIFWVLVAIGGDGMSGDIITGLVNSGVYGSGVLGDLKVLVSATDNGRTGEGSEPCLGRCGGGGQWHARKRSEEVHGVSPEGLSCWREVDAR